MRKFLGFSLVVLLVFCGVISLVSCAKKAVQSDEYQLEEAESQMTDSDAEESDQQALEKQRFEEKRLEEERLAAEEARLQEEREAMAAKEMFVSKDIRFEFDSAVIVAEAQPILQEKAAWMNDNPDVLVIVEGHCDERGTEAYNLALGERRASAAKNYLIDLGIDPERLVSISYGEERPVDPMQTEAAWAKNRRAHFSIEKN